MVQLPDSLPKDPRDLINLLLGSSPVTSINRVAYAREESLVIARPKLWREDDVFELCAVWELHLLRTFVSKDFDCGEGGY